MEGSSLAFDPAWLEGMPASERRQMVMHVGAGVARRIAEATRHDSSPVGLIGAKLDHPSSAFTHGWANMVAVEAEPWEWEQLSAWCKRNGLARATDSATLRNRARACMNLAGRIDHQIARLAKHPAYRRVSVAGVHPIVLPALRCGDAYAPTPGTLKVPTGHDGQVVEWGELLPYACRVRNRMFTSWLMDVYDEPSDPETGVLD